MSDRVTNDTEIRRINSYQKLRFLLFLYRHPEMKGTSQEFAERLYLGYTPLFEEMITDLHSMGWVDRVENDYKLPNEPNIRLSLQRLAGAFENPLSRQKMLDQMRYEGSIYLERLPG